jgi:uncharacterized membrane protein SpoIIM required for sporulation
MDIDSFVEDRRAVWLRLEKACRDGRRGLTRMTGPAIQELKTAYLVTSADLSEVQTRYRDRELAAYLSGLLATASSALYSSQPRTVRGLVRVFGARYRRAVYDTRPFILVAAATMVLAMVATYFWVVSSPDAQNGILPSQARTAIRQAGGRSPDLLGRGPELSSLIFFNNARVALLSFALGITFGAGTLFVLASNGFVLGALGGGYAALGRFGSFLALVVPHGLLELTAICIAAGAGLRIGWAIIEPGDRPRSRALAGESTEAVIAVVGAIPAFLAAALIEGFVTGTAVPNSVEMGLGLAAEAVYIAFLLGWPRGRSRPRLGSTDGQLNLEPSVRFDS